ncbi:MAG: recombinase family protein [Firmicutes bacterium]|nr:recombinase family protein [Bacillota bacterium]
MSEIYEIPVDVSHLIKKRVVIYARVSTELVEQETSYERQVLELAKSVRDNKDYNLVCVYADKESGRSMNRPAFTQMLELVNAGAIDLILTKSIARFGRNIIEVVNIIQELRLKGVEIYFEKENLSTSNPTMDFTLSLLSAHAEEESRQISMNTIWAFESKMKRGLNTTSGLYGYSIKGDIYTIIEDEAVIVRKIYSWYILGHSYKNIIQYLQDMRALTPSGKDKWSQRTLEDILKNEKYVGDMLLRKKMNDRIVRPEILSALNLNQYYVSNHHEPIITRETWNEVLDLRKKKTKFDGKGKIFKLNPYAYFYYSQDFNRHFTYYVERHKGKYEVPTLICKCDLGRFAFRNNDIENGISLAASHIIKNKDKIMEHIKHQIAPTSLRLANQLDELYWGIEDRSVNEQINRYSIISDNLSKLHRINEVEKLVTETVYHSKKLAVEPNIELIKKVFTKVIFTGFKVHLIISLTNDDFKVIPENKYLIHSYRIPIIYKYKHSELEFNLYIC